MLHVLTGEDDFSIRQVIEEIKKGIGDPESLMTNTTVMDGRQVTVEELKNACETVPFLADKRLVIVEGLLGRFESGSKTGRRKTKRNNGKQEEYKLIADNIRHLPEFTELVLTDGKINERNPLWTELGSFARVRVFPLLKEGQLKQWIEKRVKANGGSISEGAVKLLLRFVGNELWTMANEIDKLILYCEGRHIEEEDIKTVVSNAKEASIFNMVDAIIESRAGVAQELYQRMLKQGAIPTQLLVMIGRQISIIYQIKDMRSRKISRGEIKSKLGLTHDFVLQKAWAQADKYSPLRIREVYHKLLEADLAIKTGKYSDELALNILIAEMAQQSTVN